jgi:hypothetical protein
MLTEKTTGEGIAQGPWS